jgi:hypothetical protein
VSAAYGVRVDSRSFEFLDTTRYNVHMVPPTQIIPNSPQFGREKRNTLENLTSHGCTYETRQTEK